MNMRKQQWRSGFTLVEVMIGMSILSLSLLGAFGLVNQTVRMIRPSREVTLSMEAAQIEMDRLRSSWTAFSALEERTTLRTTDNQALAALPDGAGTVYKIPYAGLFSNAPVFSVSVEISWKEQGGGRDTNVLVSIIGQRGIVRR